jgi:hypothetical protein
MLAALSLAFPAAAQGLLKQSEWLPPGASIAGDLLHRPVEALEGGANQTFYVEFGRLAFRSPEILGGNARRAGMSCNACHTNGHVNDRFFVPGLSAAPGTIDVTHALWNRRGEDGVANPLPIPTLRNVATKPRLGHDLRTASLREFVRNVVVTEFDGPEPAPFVLDALVAYLTRLRAPQTATLETVTLAGDLANLAREGRVLNGVLLDEDPALAELTIRMVRGQIGGIAERFHRPEHKSARAVLAGWVADLRAVEAATVAADFPAARRALPTIAAAPAALLEAAGTSLYDPATVQKVFP